MAKAYMGRMLFIDLTLREYWDALVPEEMQRLFIGGKGYAVKILYDLLPAGTDPFSPDNIIAICSGPLTGTLAPAMRGCIATKSPLNGMLNDSYFGGHLSQELKYAGYDSIIIKGCSERPSYISVEDSNVRFHDANRLWGQDTHTTNRLIKEELGDDTYQVCCIGPAGENLVKFSLVDCDPNRHAGRGGVGAVFGSKKLKGIAIKGNKGISIFDPSRFDTAVERAISELNSSLPTKDFAENSSASVLEFSNLFGLLPVSNFQHGSTEDAAKLAPSVFSNSIWMRHIACAGCPIHCGKMGFIKKGPFSGQISDNVEYETIGMLGTNLGVFSPEALSAMNQKCDKHGIDTISTGNVIGFLFEAYEKGLLSEEETEGLELSFGNIKSIMSIIDKIALRQGIGNILAEGTKAASKMICKNEAGFACHLQGLETPAWGPRGSYGMALAYLTGDRGGCHQRSFPIAYEASTSSPIGPVTDGWSITGKAELVKWEQDLLAALYSLCICEFGRSGISIDTYIELLNAAVGTSLTPQEFLSIGGIIWDIGRMFNTREGWNSQNNSMPTRFLDQLQSGLMKGHQLDINEINTLLLEYYEARGWSQEGRVTQSALLAKLAEAIKPMVFWQQLKS